MKIALVGPGGVGKDTLSEYACKNYHLDHVSSSDLIRQYIIENKLGTPDRITMRQIATDLRAKYGADYLVRRAIELHEDDIVLSGLRAVAEAQTFKNLGGVIISIDAPVELRYEWAKHRTDIDNTMTFEHFRERDTAESSNTDPNAQNINACMALADYAILNKADKESLLSSMRSVMESLVARHTSL